MHGVLWPQHWLYDSATNDIDDKAIVYKADGKRKIPSNIALPERIMKVKFIMSQDILYHVANLCTFGICSPFLATIITICLIMKLFTWIMILGRFLSFRRTHAPGSTADETVEKSESGVQMQTMSSFAKTDNSNSKSGTNSCDSETVPEKVVRDNAVVALSESCVSFLAVFDNTLWPIIWSSCLFFATLAFDIAADEVVSVSGGVMLCMYECRCYAVLCCVVLCFVLIYSIVFRMS